MIKGVVDAKSLFGDWLNNAIEREQLKLDIKICLVKSGYPPQYTPEVFREVMEQVENFKENEQVDYSDVEEPSAPVIPIYAPIDKEGDKMMVAEDKKRH